MSSSKTTHLQLNQWIPSDPVLRTEFNADNVRLDAAVESRSLLRMAEGTLSSIQGSIQINVGSFDLRKFRELQIFCAPVVAAGSYSGSLAGPVVRLSLNGSTTLTTLQRISAAADARQGLTVHMILAPAGPCGYILSSSGTVAPLNLTDSVNYGNALTLTLSLTDNSNFGVGTWYEVYGIAK